MGAPSKVLELVQRFEDRRAEYIHPDYLEARARIDFINPLFEALGWDIANKAGLAEFEREVVTEDRIRVSRGGRPDLAGAVLGRVRARTLLVVGGRDRTVLALNRAALEGLTGRARLEVVPGASHLFPEPGALERVAELAVAWFLAHLAGELASEQATS